MISCLQCCTVCVPLTVGWGAVPELVMIIIIFPDSSSGWLLIPGELEVTAIGVTVTELIAS